MDETADYRAYPDRDALTLRTPKGSRSMRRLVALERFLKQSADCGVALRTPAGAGLGEVCFVRASAGSDPVEDSTNCVPGLTRILASLYFNDEPASGPRRETTRPRRCPKPRGIEGQLYPDLEIDPRRSAGALVDGQLASVCHAEGKVHGSLLHSHVERMVKRYQAAGSSASPFYTASEANGFRWDPCALRVMDYLAEHQYWPVATEVVVHDPILNVATAIDLVVVDTLHNKDVVFIELKSSTSDKPFEAVGGGQPLQPMRAAPFSEVPDDKLHRAIVQSIHTAMLAMRTGNGFRADRCVVLFVSPDVAQVQEYPMPDWYLQNPEELETRAYQSMLTSRQHTRYDIMATALPLDSEPAPKKKRAKKRSAPDTGQQPRKRAAKAKADALQIDLGTGEQVHK